MDSTPPSVKQLLSQVGSSKPISVSLKIFLIIIMSIIFKNIFKKKVLMIIIRKLFKETEICFNEPNWLNNSLTEGRGGIVSKLSKRPS